MNFDVSTLKDFTEVQFFLDNLESQQRFTVIFIKISGEQRKLTGILDDKSRSRKENVPMMTEEGWKSFNIHRVLYIGN